MSSVPYRITVHNIEACNCTVACGCQFAGLPDKGGCEAVIGGEVKEGKYGDVQLQGVRYVFAFMYPKAIHQGNGKVAVFIDSKANEKQAEAMSMILSGKAGGMPIVAASPGAAPAANAVVNVAITVSPAPVTSAISSVPWIGMKLVAPSRSSKAISWRSSTWSAGAPNERRQRHPGRPLPLPSKGGGLGG